METYLGYNNTSSSGDSMPCDAEDLTKAIYFHATQISASIVVTLSVLAMFIGTRTIFNKIRGELAELIVVVIGAGPIGLTSALIAANCKRVTRLIVFEERSRFDVEQKSYQIAIRSSNIAFLRKYGLDFDNLEGIWHEGSFYTRVGIYLEYLINVLPLHDATVEFNFSTKTRFHLDAELASAKIQKFLDKRQEAAVYIFSKDCSQLVDDIPGRKLVICCDGSNGQAARALGMNDECTQHLSGILGSVAVIERPNKTLVPTPEKRVHNLNFDLTAYGGNMYDEDGKSNFTLKIFGNSRHRYMSLAVLKSDAQVVKALKTFLDKSMMRNIFLKCFNTYKPPDEATVSDSYCLNNMKFSPRLAEIKLSQRIENVAYIDDCDVFVIAEGGASRTYNFNTGMDVNVGIKGLTSLQPFIEKVVWAQTEYSILSALVYKMEHSDKVTKDFLKHGLKEYVFS